MRPARSAGTWVLAAALSAALLGVPPALASDAGTALASAAVTPRTGIGVSIDADLRVTPGRYSPGEALEVTVAGTLTTTAIRDVVCHSLTLTAARGGAPLLTRYSSTDRTPQRRGEVHTQEVRAALEIEAARLTGGGAITVSVDLQCSPMDAEGDWSVLDAQSETIANGRISPAAGTIVLSSTWIFPDDEERRVRPVTVSVTAKGTTRIIVTRGRTTVWQTSSSKSSYQVSIPLSRTRQAGTYVVTVSGDATSRRTFQVSRGWAPLVDSVASWPRCSTVTWAYSEDGAPRGADAGMIADLQRAFDRFEELTGLRFRQSADADIRIGWGKAPFDGPDASAGAAERDGVLGSGILTLFSSSDWAATPGFGMRGRGALLYHEIGHILGLGHVKDRRLLMYPIHTVGQSPLSPQAGDIAGLRELYAPSSCR